MSVPISQAIPSSLPPWLALALKNKQRKRSRKIMECSQPFHLKTHRAFTRETRILITEKLNQSLVWLLAEASSPSGILTKDELFCCPRPCDQCMFQCCVLSCSVMSDSCNPRDCSLPASFVYGILQARILKWVAIFSSRGSSRPQKSNPGLLHRRQTLYQLSYEGSSLSVVRGKLNEYCTECWVIDLEVKSTWDPVTDILRRKGAEMI